MDFTLHPVVTDYPIYRLNALICFLSFPFSVTSQLIIIFPDEQVGREKAVEIKSFHLIKLLMFHAGHCVRLRKYSGA